MEVKINMVKDPVCGMNVDEKTTALKSEYMGKTYYFCNQSAEIHRSDGPLLILTEQ
jgi:YHS domain-containing protein